MAATRAAIARLDVPATDEWIKGRIGTFLLHFYVAGLPAPAVRAISEDWLQTLKPYPQWAIEAACLWWIGPDNPKSDHKPSAGKIAKRAKAEMGLVELGKKQLDFYERYGEHPPSFLKS